MPTFKVYGRRQVTEICRLVVVAPSECAARQEFDRQTEADAALWRRVFVGPGHVGVRETSEHVPADASVA